MVNPAAVLAIVVVLIGSTGWLDAFGAAPGGERLARIRQSPNYRDGAFKNPDATSLASTGRPGPFGAIHPSRCSGTP